MKNVFLLILTCAFFVTSFSQTSFVRTNLPAGTYSGLTTDQSGNLYTCSISGILFRSSDNGTTWSSANTGFNVEVRDIMFIPPTGTMILTTKGRGILRSTDNGVTFTQVSGSEGLEIRQLDYSPATGTIYAGSFNVGMIRSTNDGVSWSPASSSVPESNTGDILVTAQGSLLAAVKGTRGIWRSTNQGSTWAKTGMTSAYYIYSLNNAPGGIIYAGAAETPNGIYKSTDDGQTWTQVMSTSTVNFYAKGLYTNGTFYIGGYGGGIFKTTDNGTSWSSVSSGFANLTGFELAEANDFLFAGAADGVYKSDKITNTESTGKTIPGTFSLMQNHPNPFNPSTVIEYQIPHDTRVNLSVFNLIGEKVATIEEGFRRAGSYVVSFNAEGLTGGLYFYRLSGDNFTATKKMLLVK